jgi:TolB-like protein/lipopolysaccharide biosynthesis regulator YciM
MRRQELLETVWPNEFVSDDTLSQRVRLLRESLGDPTENPRYVASRRGWGYRLIAPVELLATPRVTIQSVAVLPLTNITGDPQLEYFADGMTETLISALAKIRALKVISRTSVMSYKQTKKKVPQIARELGVEAIVEGTVLVTKERVRVSAQLVRAANDEHLWAEIYDRDLGDVLALHDDLARAIAHEVRAALTPEEEGRFENQYRVKPDALKKYLKGRHFLWRMTPADMDRAIDWFEEAIAEDEAFAEAYSGLAHACLMRGLPVGTGHSVDIQRQFLSRSKAAAERAVNLNERLAEAYAAIGFARLFHDWDWRGAGQALDRALQVGYNCALAHGHRAILASTILDHDRTMSELRIAVELDPVNLLIHAESGEVSYWARDHSKAIAYALETLELDPSFPRAHFVLGRIYEAQGKIAEAIAEYEQARVISGQGSTEAITALQKGGSIGYHRWALEAQIKAMGSRPAEELKTHAPVDEHPFFLAKNYARLGETDKAMKCLEQSYKEHDCLLVLLKALEWWDPLRSDPRFQNLMRRVGIP